MAEVGMEEEDSKFDRPAWAGQAHIRRRGMWSPSVDLVQREKELIAHIDLPGVKKDDITVTISPGSLTIEGERNPASPPDRIFVSDPLFVSERAHGKFYRLIPLPGKIDEERVSANFQNGVLEITLPIEELQGQAREIAVCERHPGVGTTDPPPPIKRL